MTIGAAVLSLALAAPLAGCSKDSPKDNEQRQPPPSSAPPPPVATANAGACVSGGGTVNDPATAALFPRTVGKGTAAYCVDPQGETRTYGEKGKLSMDEVCTTAVDGECEVYKRFGLKRFVSFRYVDGAGTGGTVEVYLSQFGDTNGAYGMFTKRVVADADPADPSAPKPVQAEGGAAMGTGRAYVWKGPYLAELQYINENESPDQIAKSSAPVLTSIAQEVGAKIPGGPEKPASARALPPADLVNVNAIQFYPKDPLGFPNVGPGAVGFYKSADKRWRLVAIQRDDADQAKDAMKTIRTKPGALPIAGLGDEAVQIVVQSSPEAAKTNWVFTRKGALICGAGDEELQAGSRLAKDDAIAKLKAWLGGLTAAKK